MLELYSEQMLMFILFVFNTISVGAVVDARTGLLQATALNIACRSGNTKLVELLLEYGADVNAGKEISS